MDFRKLLRGANPLGKPSRVEIGGFRADAIHRCVEIHAEAFHRGWDEGEFSRLLNDLSVISAAAQDARSGDLIGFALSRRALDEAEILTIAVAKSARGSGVGGQLLRHHLADLARAGVRELFLEVNSTNTAARALYAATGFEQVGERRGYYQTGSGPAASALILKRDMT
jgi:ribosomal-protein-alanine N-acetyltransferase